MSEKEKFVAKAEFVSTTERPHWLVYFVGDPLAQGKGGWGGFDRPPPKATLKATCDFVVID